MVPAAGKGINSIPVEPRTAAQNYACTLDKNTFVMFAIIGYTNTLTKLLSKSVHKLELWWKEINVSAVIFYHFLGISMLLNSSIPDSIEDQDGQSLEQSGLAECVPAYGRAIGTKWYLPSFPTLIVLRF